MSALAEALQTDSLVGWWVTTTLLSLVVLAVAAVADLALRRFAAPGVRMALYVAVLVRVVLPADWHSPVGMVQTKIQASATVIDAPNPAALASTPASAPIVIEGETTAAVDASRPWLAYGLLGLWGLGGAGLLVVIARRLRAGRAIADAASHVATMDDTTIHVHPTAGPLVAGIVRPKIVVPAAMLDDVDPAVLRAVVRHEQAHVDHRDPWSTFALACFCALMWPVVPIWLAVGRIRLLMEMRADAVAIAGCTPAIARDYRRLLLGLAATRWHAPVLAPGLGPVSGLRARLGAMATRPAMPSLLQVLFVLPLAIGLVLVAARRVDPSASPAAPTPEVAPNEPAQPLPAELTALGFPSCREHAAALTEAISDPEAARVRPQLLVARRVFSKAAIPEMVDATAASVLRGVTDAAARGEAEYVIGLGYAELGRVREAEAHLSEATWQLALVEHDLLAAEAAAAAALVVSRAGRADEASAWSRHAVASYRRSGRPGPLAIEMHRELARVAERSGDRETAAHERMTADRIDVDCEIVSP